MRFTLLSGLAAALSIVTVSALPTISTQGSYFFTSDGDRWFVKGIAYQLSESDPLLDATQCSLDAALMKTLGANAIRVYHVSPGQDHSACMNTFADNGIYLFVDLDTFNTQINELTPEWNSTQLSAFELIMDEFHSFTNTAGFFIGNEVLTGGANTEAAAYVKASVRDLKAYRNQKGYREIPIGYSHADISSLRPNLQNYLACGNDSTTIDFFGLNSYEWCGSTSYVTSGYAALTAQIKSYPIPIFFSETGCNVPEPRTFEDQTAIFGSNMSPYWSGAIIYEWIQEVNHYGIITYGDDTDALVTSPIESATAVTRSGTPTPVTPDFSNLMAQWATITPSSLAQSAYSASNTAPACPAYTVSVWEIAGDIALPTVGEVYNSAVQYSISAGSLMSGATSTGTASGTAATASTTASSTSTGAASRATSGGKELPFVGIGLGSVMLGFVWLL